MQVIGSAEEARGLSQGILVKTKTIHELTKAIAEKTKTLQGSYRDEGFEELNSTVIRIFQSIDAHLNDVVSLQNALKAYAEILERSN